MRLGGNSIHVIYQDSELASVAENEKLEQVRRGISKTDQ